MKKLTLLLSVAILLAACGPAATPQPTPVPATPTSAPVEAPVSSITDLVGIWWFPRGPIKVEFKPDGSFRAFTSDGTQGEGNITLDAGKITWVTSHPTCNDQPATYEAYVTRQDGKPVQLRLHLVGNDPCSIRVESMNGIAKYQSP
jgi:hypothetical protein